MRDFKEGKMKKYLLIMILLCFCSAIAGGYIVSKQKAIQQENFLTSILNSSSTAEITSTVTVLNKIRKGDIEGATELLEKLLDVELQAQAYATPKAVHVDYVDRTKAIKIAKTYRDCYKSHIVHPKLIDSVNKTLSFVNISSAHKCE